MPDTATLNAVRIDNRSQARWETLKRVNWCGGENDHGKRKNDHGSSVTKRPIKIRNEKRTKRT